MPRGGQNKKNKELKVLEGKANPYQTENTPKVEPIFPDKPPRGLPKYAKEFWKKHAPLLNKAGIATHLDVETFRVLCLTYNTIRECEDEIQQKGLLIPGARGNEMVKNPCVSILNQARQQFRLQAAQFGLDPVSRGRITGADIGDEESEMEKLLNQNESRLQR